MTKKAKENKPEEAKENKPDISVKPVSPQKGEIRIVGTGKSVNMPEGREYNVSPEKAEILIEKKFAKKK